MLTFSQASRLIVFLTGILWVLITLGIHFAIAQEIKTPLERSLFSRVHAEVNANIQCVTTATELNDKLLAAQAEIKRLTDKYEPKPEKE